MDGRQLHHRWFGGINCQNRVYAAILAKPPRTRAALSSLHGLRLPVPARAWQQSLLEMAEKFAAIEQQQQATLNAMRQNNEAIWLALAREGGQ
jgi:hypothetical protein